MKTLTWKIKLIFYHIFQINFWFTILCNYKYLFMKFESRILSVFAVVILMSVGGCKKDVQPTREKSVLKNTPVVASSTGITGGGSSGNINFSFGDARDLAIPFYLTNFGVKYSAIICYRPGTGLVSAFINSSTGGAGSAPVFSNVYNSTAGLGGYNMLDNRDRIVPFDLYNSGYYSALFCYRPGGNAWSIVTWNGSSFIPVTSGTSIGTWTFTDSRDVVTPFDYFSTGKVPDLLIYRPGTGKCVIIHNVNSGGTPGYTPEFSTTTGFGSSPNNYDLMSNNDVVLGWDALGNSHFDCILAYRPGAGVLATYHSGTFSNLSFSRSGITSYNSGTQNYNLNSVNDRIVFYQPAGQGIVGNNGCWVVRPGSGTAWSYVNMVVGTNNLIHQGNGIGVSPNIFDLSSTADKVIAWDCDNIGKYDHLISYRPGKGAFWVFNNTITQDY